MIVKNIPIQPKQVIKKFEIVRTEHFVRDSDILFRRTAELLAEIRTERAHINTSPQHVGMWAGQIRRFSKQLNGSVPPVIRIYELVKWYRGHYDDDEFIPRVEAAGSLIDKFSRLEAAMKQRVKLKHANGHDLTSEQVLKQNGVTHPRLLDSMVRDIVIPARRLHLIDVKTDAVLTEKIVELYNAIRDERDDANLTTSLKLRIGGPLEILRRYINWVAEQDWEASSRILKSDSPAFASFRRDFRNLEGVDPIDGRERSYD